MSRPVKAGERWSTFIFDGIDCADLGVYSITNGSTYTTYLTPTYKDKTTEVTAYDGKYYYDYTLKIYQKMLTLGFLFVKIISVL